MNHQKILNTIDMSIAGVYPKKEVKLNNSYIIFYQCENNAFNDTGHMYDCFNNAINIMIKRNIAYNAIIKAEKINNGHTLMKVIIYE